MYKLVQIDGEPVLKRSEDTIKLINPGLQLTYRVIRNEPGKEQTYEADVTCLRGDSIAKKIEAGEEFTIYAEDDRFKHKTFNAGTYTWRTLQHPVIKDGKDVSEAHTLQEKKAFFNDTLAHFSPSERRLINPHYYKVDISDDLYKTKIGILSKLNEEIAAFKID